MKRFLLPEETWKLEGQDTAIVNDIRNFAFGLAKASVYGFGKNRKQKLVMSITICENTKAVGKEL